MARIGRKYIASFLVTVFLCLGASTVLAATQSIILRAQDTPEDVHILLQNIEASINRRLGDGESNDPAPSFLPDRERQYILSRLKAEGYYGASVDQDGTHSNVVMFKVRPGKRYTYGNVTFFHNAQRPDAPDSTIPLDVLPALSGKPAAASRVFDGEQFLRKWVEQNRCFLNYDVSHQAVADRKTRTIHVDYQVRSGTPATFGDITFTGQTRLTNAYLDNFVDVSHGDCFKQSNIDQIILRLQQTGLVQTVRVDIPPGVDSQGRVDVTFNITESKHRTVRGGVKYSTDIGPSVSASWEHRNLWGGGENVQTILSLASIEQDLTTQYLKPYFIRHDQTLNGKLRLFNEDNDAFETTGISSVVGIERRIDDNWNVGMGVGIGFERITTPIESENVALLDFPLFISHNNRDDILNPSRGWTFSNTLTPSIDIIDTGTRIVKNVIRSSYYQSLNGDKLVLASRIAAGGIYGVDTQTVPATERFYTGGGASIRGYGYQLVGPLDVQRDPLGGRSFVEVSFEVRHRFTELFGGVLFVDGGNTYDTSIPNFEAALQWGVGVGLRYYTTFGPLRLDIGVPLNKRQNVDEDIQFYLGVGQAF